jgi:hypothetical protein
MISGAFDNFAAQLRTIITVLSLNTVNLLLSPEINDSICFSFLNDYVSVTLIYITVMLLLVGSYLL